MLDRFSFSFAAIGAVVVTLVTLRVVPYITLRLNQDAYGRLVVACEGARESQREADGRLFDNEPQKTRFLKSIQIELLACVDRDILHDQLISSGVPEPRIRTVELQALMGDPDLPAAALNRTDDGRRTR